MRRPIVAFIAAAAAFSIAGAALAGPPEDAAAEALIACLDVADAGERLSCLEGAAAEIKALRAVAAASGRQKSDDLFGAESVASKKKEKREEEKTARLDAGVAEIHVGPLKNVTVVLDNGQVWRQLEGDRTEVRAPRNPGELTVSVTKGAFGNYWMKINELGREIRVKRIK